MVFLPVTGGLRIPTTSAATSSSTLAKLPSRQPHADGPGGRNSFSSSLHAPSLQHRANAVNALSAAAPADNASRVHMLRTPLATDQVKSHPLPSSLHGVPASEVEEDLPQELYSLLDPFLRVQLPAPDELLTRKLNNWKLDKLISQLGRNKATWRRALVLYEWLKDSGHQMDDRLCTTLIRLCADQRDAMTALSVYEWMRAPASAGGAALRPTVFTYTAVMRAALNSNLLDRSMKVWEDAQAAGLRPDSRLCVIFMEACTRLGQTDRAMSMYSQLRQAPPRSPHAPSVHVYTAAMRAASEGGRWNKALDIWADMKAAGCEPTAHAYAAVISACAAGCAWVRAVSLFEEMTAAGIQPDVVSCTALITALASSGEADKAEAVVQWMLANGLKPNVRTYTALMSAMASAKQCNRAVEMLYKMQLPEWGEIQPNAYTYSVLIKSLGESGQWQLAEAVFGHVEQVVLASRAAAAAPGRQPPQQAITASEAAAAWQRSNALSLQQQQQRQEASGQHSGRVWSSASQLNGINLNLLPPQHESQQKQVQAMATGSGTGAVVNGFSLFSQSGSSSMRMVSRPSHFGGAREAALASMDQQSPASSAAAEHSLLNPNSHVSTTMRPTSSSMQQQDHGQDCPINEVVCGSLMLAYERAGMWAEAVGVIGRARTLGLVPNTVMYNTAIAASGKAGQLEVAEKLFAAISEPDAVTFESLIAAFGLCGQPQKAEATLRRMTSAGFKPRDYAYCGLIAAHSLAGDVDAALAVRRRVRQDGAAVSIHIYNALLAACERGHRAETALKLLAAMKKEGLEPNIVTNQLMSAVGRQGVQSVEGQQAALAAISAAVAAAGTILIHRGVF